MLMEFQLASLITTTKNKEQLKNIFKTDNSYAILESGTKEISQNVRKAYRNRAYQFQCGEIIQIESSKKHMQGIFIMLNPDNPANALILKNNGPDYIPVKDLLSTNQKLELNRLNGRDLRALPTVGLTEPPVTTMLERLLEQSDS